MKRNLHTHTTWCDGRNTPEEMVVAAIEKGFDELGFSSHSDMVSDIPAYIADIRSLAEKYCNRIRILCGLEAEGGDSLGFAPQLDYVIGSLHYITAPDGVRVSVDNTPEIMQTAIRENFGGDAVAYVKAYFAQQREMIVKQTFDILGHPDLVRKFNAKYPYFDESAAWYRDELEKTADIIAASGRVVEINTGAISRGWMDDAYPSASFREMLAARDVPFILSSDAHAADALDTGFDRFLKL